MPAPAAAGLQLLRRGRGWPGSRCSCRGPCRRPGPDAAGGRRFLVPLRQAGGGPAGRVGPAAVQRRCWLVLDFKHTFLREGAGGVRAAGGPRGSRTDAGRGAARTECLATAAALRASLPPVPLSGKRTWFAAVPGLGARPAGAGAADPGVGGSAWIRGFPRQAVLFPEADLQWSAKACNVFQATAARERKRLAGREANPFKTITFNRFDLPCG